MVSSFNKINKYYQANCLVQHDCVGCLLQILQNHHFSSYRLCFVPLLTRSIPGAAGISAGGILGLWTCMARGCQKGVTGVLEQERSSFFQSKKGWKKGCTKIQLLQHCNAFPAITSLKVLVGVDMITVGLHLSFQSYWYLTGVPKLPCSFCQLEKCIQRD